MPYYRVEPIFEADANAYWVAARCESNARELVALNVPGAVSTVDPERYDCWEDVSKMPPASQILCRRGGPITIRARELASTVLPTAS